MAVMEAAYFPGTLGGKAQRIGGISRNYDLGVAIIVEAKVHKIIHADIKSAARIQNAGGVKVDASPVGNLPPGGTVVNVESAPVRDNQAVGGIGKGVSL
jgi:hypothetical protein